jgi:hypothetical protein
LQRLNMGNEKMFQFPKTKHVYKKREKWNVNSPRIQLRLDLFGVACTALAGVGRGGGIQ